MIVGKRCMPPRLEKCKKQSHEGVIVIDIDRVYGHSWVLPFMNAADALLPIWKLACGKNCKRTLHACIAPATVANALCARWGGSAHANCSNTHFHVSNSRLQGSFQSVVKQL